MDDGPVSQNCYEILQVHPAAPQDLIAAAYWWLINRQREASRAGFATEVALHRLTKAYQTLADPDLRRSHDGSLRLPRYAPFPPIPARLQGPPRRRRSLIGRRAPAPPPEEGSVDYHEVLRVHPGAEPSILALARAMMRDHYLRHVRFGDAPAGLLKLLEEAYTALSNPAVRGQAVGRTGSQAGSERPSMSPAAWRGRRALTRFRGAARGVVEAGSASHEEATILGRFSGASQAASAKGSATDAPGKGLPAARLVITGGPQTGAQFALDGRPLTLGAAGRCDVVLAETAPSQACIWAKDGQFIVLNLREKPAIMVGGQPLVRAPLRDGDLLTIGPHRIRFDLTRR